MATSDSNGFTNLVPGFDFLQGLMKNAGAALPNMGQWVAPTLDPAELEKRIEELRTVQFWLEQNARLLGTTIQALEVQRMTLSTLKTMNVQMGDLRESLKIRVPGAAPAAAVPPAVSSWFSPPPESSAPASADAAVDATDRTPKPKRTTKAADHGVATPAVDPMKWWGALTQQFTQLAANAVQDGSAETAKTLAAKTMQQSFEAAGAAFRQAVPGGAAPTKIVKSTRSRAPRKAASRASVKRSPSKSAAKR